MDVSRMTISEETRKKLQLDYPLSRSRKTRIRREGVFSLIRSKPSGYLFKAQELVEAAGFHSKNGKKEYNNGYNFVYNLIKTGRLVKVGEVGTKKSSYSVVEDSKIVSNKINKPKTINRKISELVVNKDADKKINENVNKSVPIINLDTGNRIYSISFSIDKKGDTEFGKKSIAELRLNETTLDIAAEMVRQTIEASK